MYDCRPLYLLACQALVPCVVLVLTWLVSALSASGPAVELPRVRTRSAKCLRRSRQDKKQKVATGLIRDELHTKDFAGPISLRASKILGPNSRYRVADILSHMKLESRASRPGLTVGFLRLLCNLLRTAQRFHTEGHEQMCRVGCPNEPDSLSHCNDCPLLYAMFLFFWGPATVLPRRTIFSMTLSDLITQVFLRSTCRRD